jgi:ABC-type nickel/cobalt efflux system permease component RcnA
MFDLNSILHPSSGLAVPVILVIALILGVLHGLTPDEHTWPITFSYSIGSYSSRGGMKAGFMFSGGFTIQRSILTAMGFAGLASVYEAYNLDGYIYVLVGAGMLLAGYYLLKGTDIHVPLDRLLGGREHHTSRAERVPMHESEDQAKPVPLKMATVHGFIAGWGVGAYASIIVFILAPQMPNIFYAALVGTSFGIGTMLMQITIGSVFANIMRAKKLSLEQIKYVGRSAAARTLYLGGLAFALIGGLIVAFPLLDSLAISTGNPIPNLDSIGVASVLVLLTVGVIGFGNLYLGYKEITASRARNL